MSDNGFKILVAESVSPEGLSRLQEIGKVQCLESCDEKTLLESIADCDALVVRTYAAVTASVIKMAGKLKVIGRAGIGVDNIDTATARDQGVIVVYTPEASTQAVADLTIGFMIALERKMKWLEGQLQEGNFLEARNSIAQRQLGELVLGIIGFGRIGQRVAEIAHAAFGMKTLYNDILEIRSHLVPAISVSKDQIYTQADVVSLHVPLTDLTHHLINADVLSRMKNTSLLINTCRGGVVDGQALAHALQSDQIAGAACDVFEQEPPASDDPLRSAPNTILTPHIAARTQTSLTAMNDVVDDVIAVLQSRAPRFPYTD